MLEKKLIKDLQLCSRYNVRLNVSFTLGEVILLRSAERSSNRVMEKNRVFLYISFYGHQFGPPKKFFRGE
jgi:hypothetical protein